MEENMINDETEDEEVEKRIWVDITNI